MSIVAEKPGVFNSPSENISHTVTSRTTTTGLRSHTVTTTNRDFAFELFGQALEFDNEPDFAAARGVFFLEFFANDAECATVILAAQGGKA